MADKNKPQEKPSKNRTSSSRQRKPDSAADDTNQSHRSAGSVEEGGQNEVEGEPHFGYGSDQGQSQGGKKQGTTN